MQASVPKPLSGNTVGQLVDALGLLDRLFDKKSRPSVRWVREQTANRTIPFIKVGHLVFFDINQVREALARRNTVKAR